MAADRNYILGRGERLTEKLGPPKMKPTKADPYTFEEAKARLEPRLAEMSRALDALPQSCCPDDETVAAIRLHPAYLAKSYFPNGLLRQVGLEPVGSKAILVEPEKTLSKKQSDKNGKPLPAPAAEIYVAGKRKNFRNWANNLKNWNITTSGADELIRVEDVRIVSPEERLKPMYSDKDKPVLEVVLHAGVGNDFIVEAFKEYMESIGASVDIDRRIYVHGLCFVPARVPKEKQKEMAKFSFLRVAREIPKLRGPAASPIKCASINASLPTESAKDPNLRAAIFDGGIPSNHGLDQWVRARRVGSLGPAVPKLQEHGLQVTSAVLFGAIEEGVALPTPYAEVDHYRVLDELSASDPDEVYFDVLERIVGILQSKNYEFVNLSLGPDLPIEDDDVHVWTARLDQLFSDGKTLVCVAAGNSGERDRPSGNARVQAPSDGVNVLAVGACDSLTGAWNRAPYSSLGPGRSPGVIKPDIVSYGGTKETPFITVAPGGSGQTLSTWGTSFASPLALRSGLAVRATIGDDLSALAIRALLIHHSDDNGHDWQEVGFGRIPTTLDELIVCPSGTASIVYQGRLEPGKYIRNPIPIPDETIFGKVTIKATFCYATETDPQDPLNYTRAGLEIVFRPHSEKRTTVDQQHANSDSFFGSVDGYKTEEELRRDSHRWETCMKSSQTKFGTSLKDPAFDIHYIAREGGATVIGAPQIPYALIITVSAPKMADIYDKIANKYQYMLEEFAPVTTQIQIQEEV